MSTTAPAAPESNVIEFKPGVWYFRKALRESRTHADAIEIAMVVIRELDRTRAWLVEGEMPIPRWEVHPTEAQEKGWMPAPDKAS